MKSKRIYLNEKKTKYCIVKLFKKRKEMHEYYSKEKPDEKFNEFLLGVHLAYERWDKKTGKIKSETGTVLLSLEDCAGSIVSHEFMHAILWAYKHKKYKKQYPITIKDMKEEEKLLHRMSLAVHNFYSWYWDVKKLV